MAELEQTTVLQVDTSRATRSISELRAEINTLRTALNDGTISIEDQAAAVEELAQLQGELRDAMNGTTEAGVEAAKAVDIENASYNTLVHTLAELTKAWRAETDASKRAELGKRVGEVNQKLKDLDATKGTFVRNVGNYASVWDKWGGSINGTLEGLGRISPTIGHVTQSMKGLGAAMKGLAANPLGAIVMVVGQLAALIPDIIAFAKAHSESAKQVEADAKANERFNASIAKQSEELERTMRFMEAEGESQLKIFEERISKLSDMRAQASRELAKAQDALKRYSTGSDNYEKQLETVKKYKEQYDKINKQVSKAFDDKEIYEIKAARSAEEQKVKIASEAAQAATQARVNAKNAEAAMLAAIDKEIADEEARLMKETADRYATEAERAAKAAQEAADNAKAQRESVQAAALAQVETDMQRALAVSAWMIQNDELRANAEYQIQAESNQRKLDLLRQFARDAVSAGDMSAYLNYQQQVADTEFEVWNQSNAHMVDSAKSASDKRLSILSAAASATSGLLNTIADIMEQNGENDEKAAEGAKNLRIASTLIDTLNGATMAYASAQSLGPIAGPIVGSINAAAVVASGMASISQMKATQVSQTSSPSTSGVSTVSVPTQVIPQVRSVTSASEEARLNKMASDNRVYVVYSDIEGAGKKVAVTDNEASF